MECNLFIEADGFHAFIAEHLPPEEGGGQRPQRVWYDPLEESARAAWLDRGRLPAPCLAYSLSEPSHFREFRHPGECAGTAFEPLAAGYRLYVTHAAYREDYHARRDARA
jgi:hypothetical protein